jgi:hypothetical protein
MANQRQAWLVAAADHRETVARALLSSAEGDHAAAVPPDGVRPGRRGPGRLRRRRAGDPPGRQTSPDTRLPHRAEPFAQSVQRGRLPSDHRRLHPLPGERLPSLRRRAADAGHRQPQSGRHEGRLVRSRAKSQDPIVLRPLRHGDPADQGRERRGTRARSKAGVDYVQDNALKGRTFTSLAEQNRHLLDWETGVADTRIHGTTREQVRKAFEREKPALHPLPVARFACFHEAKRKVNRDGHVEVDKAYYSAPPEYLWDVGVGALGQPGGAHLQRAFRADRDPHQTRAGSVQHRESTHPARGSAAGSNAAQRTCCARRT